MTHTLHPEIEKAVTRLAESVANEIYKVPTPAGINFVKGVIKDELGPYLLPPSQHLKDEQFVEQFEKYCEEELKQSTPKIEPHIQKIQGMGPYNEMTVVESKINELIDDNMRLWDYINNKD